MKKLSLLFAGVFLFAGMSFAQTYVGPERCLTCHNNPGLGDATGWRSSMHANGYSVVLDDAHQMEDLYGVVNDYDENGIDDFHVVVFCYIDGRNVLNGFCGIVFFQIVVVFEHVLGAIKKGHGPILK